MEKNYNETVDFREFKWEYRKKAAMDFLRSIPGKVRDVWERDRELIVFATPAVIFAIKKIAGVKADIREDFHRDRQVYDRSLGMYHTLRRPMRPDEKVEFSERRADGESVISILRSMGLLRK